MIHYQTAHQNTALQDNHITCPCPMASSQRNPQCDRKEALAHGATILMATWRQGSGQLGPCYCPRDTPNHTRRRCQGRIHGAPTGTYCLLTQLQLRASLV